MNKLYIADRGREPVQVGTEAALDEVQLDVSPSFGGKRLSRLNLPSITSAGFFLCQIGRYG
jgi:hypothetical protein